jgi:hypothetical protein
LRRTTARARWKSDMLRIMVFADITAMVADVLIGSSESWGVSEDIVAEMFGCCAPPRNSRPEVACLRTKPTKSVRTPMPRPTPTLMVSHAVLTCESHSSLLQTDHGEVARLAGCRGKQCSDPTQTFTQMAIVRPRRCHVRHRYLLDRIYNMVLRDSSLAPGSKTYMPYTIDG